VKKLLIGVLLISANLYPMETLKTENKPSRHHHRRHHHRRHTHSTDSSVKCLGMDEKELYEIMAKAITVALKKEIEKREKSNNAPGFFMRCATGTISAVISLVGRYFLPL